MRRLIFLSLILAGCGSTPEAPVATTVQPSPSPTSVLAPLSAQIDALGPATAATVYQRAALWNDSQPLLTGTVAEAVNASVQMGAPTLARLVTPLQDGGQTVVTTYGKSDAPRQSDCLTVVPAGSTFHCLRVLSAVGMPPVARQDFKNTRNAVPLPANGAILSKVIKLTDLEKYLNGTYDPKAFGFQAVASDLVGLNTSAQLIEGLRLDYPGGFAGETRVGQLLYPQLASFTLQIPYGAAFGGTQTGSYPFSGNGYTATTMPRTIPEWVLPSSGADLAPGSQLYEVDERGQHVLRGTWTGATWGVAAKVAARTRIDRPARARGAAVWVISREGDTAHVSSAVGILDGQSQLGRSEFRGTLPWAELDF